MILRTLCLLLETLFSMTTLIGGLEVFIQPSTSSSSSTSSVTTTASSTFVHSMAYYLYLSMFYLSNESHIENIEKKSSKFHWIFYHPTIVSFIFTPWPIVEILSAIVSHASLSSFLLPPALPSLHCLRVLSHLSWTMVPLQVIVKFYGLAWLGRDRAEMILSRVGLSQMMLLTSSGNANASARGSSSNQCQSSPLGLHSEPLSAPNSISSKGNGSFATQKRDSITFLAVLITHTILWANLVGHTSLFHPNLAVKVIAIILLLIIPSNSSTIYSRWVSLPRAVLRKYSLMTSLMTLTCIDFAMLLLTSHYHYHHMIDGPFVLMLLLQAILSFLPMNFLLHAYLRRPKQLSYSEYTKMLWKCRGNIPYKTIKMKKLHYYISTNQTMITKELPTGITAMMITIPFSSGAMRDAYYIFLQPSNTLYQIEELHELFYRQEEANNDLVIGKLYNASTKKAMKMMSHDRNKSGMNPHPSDNLGGGAGVGDKDREKDKERDKEKVRERERDKDREKERDREREREKNGNYTNHPLREQMFNDLYMHCKAQEYAICYNQHEHTPPKSVEFVQAVIFEYTELGNTHNMDLITTGSLGSNVSSGSTSGASSGGMHSGGSKLIWIEEKIEGEFDKYSNNAGWVNNTRLSPHAFSHFTYHQSKHKLVVVDMQGAENRYTDPQIHSVVTIMTSVWQFFGLEKKEEFGCGNLGKKGIELWKETHQCSDLCKALGLPEINHPTKLLSSGDGAVAKVRQNAIGRSGGNVYAGSTIMALKQHKGARK